MTPERYTQVKSLFQLVLDQPADQRQVFLEKACGADRELYVEVRNLITADSSSADFLSHPAMTPVSQILEQAAREQEESVPKQIGPYAIQRQIGVGGMGAVYLASRADQHYSKLVAIKVIRRGMEQDRIIQRFRRERQIVASLDHPNIARLLDGGAAEDGRPYFVMEYVEGHPIDTYCDERKLSLEERLRIFCDVCAAVHYAHQNLVVHRDLKPGNILVKLDGVPKLLDFGIAKILTPDSTAASEKTATSMRLMTPQYASPEQVRGEAVTTVSDVYLLGIILYELLTGHRPYPLKDGVTLELLRAMTQSEPEPPSAAISRVVDVLTRDGGRQIIKNPTIVASTRATSPAALRKQLTGDLDAIVLRSLRRDAKERYQSAAQLADDIRRYLSREPVSAVPDNAVYRVRLFFARNRALATTISAALALILLFAVVAGWQARSARIQRDLAARRFEEVRKVANSFLFEVHDAIAPLPGTTPARRLLVTKAIEYLNNLAKESGNDTAIQRELASAWLRVGHLQGNPNHANLGDADSARRSYQTALQILRALPQAPPLDLGAALEGIADLDANAGDSPKAQQNYQEARRIFEQAAAPAPILAANYQNLASVLAATGQTAAALELARKSHDLADSAGDARLLAIAKARLGGIEHQAGLFPEAKKNLETALQFLEKLNDGQPNALHQRDLSFVLEDLARYGRRNNDPQAPIHQQRSLALRRSLALADPQNSQAQRDLAYAYLRQGEPAALQLAQEIFSTQLARDGQNPMARRDAALGHQKLGDALLANNQVLQAVEHYRRFLQLAQQWQATDTSSLYAVQMLAAAHLKLAEGLPKLADPQGGLQNARRAVSLLDDLVRKDPASTLFRRDHALANFILGRTLLETKSPAAQNHLNQAKSEFNALVAEKKLAVEDRVILEALERTLGLARSTAF